MTFNDFNFEPDLGEGLEAMGYSEPTPIQQEAIPLILEGKDLIACAQTGTGKTASYLLPLINNIAKGNKEEIAALILAPTRELAQQIDQQVEGLAYFSGVSSVPIFGGGDGIVYEQQRRAIQNKVNILIATPGRLIQHLNSGILNLKSLKYLVLDEADRMLDMGFYDDIRKIINHLPKKRQTLLFSATMPPRIRSLAKTTLINPQQINLAPSQPAAGIEQQIFKVTDVQKVPLIQLLLKKGSFASIIIFASTKEKVKDLHRALKSMGIQAKAFHSDLEQNEREEILREFRNQTLRVLIGTDVLSRGIDVEGIDLVINFDAPSDPEDYIHRIGRTARAEATGTAITLVNEKDQRKLLSIERIIGKELPVLRLPEEIGEQVEFSAATSNRRRPPQGKKKFKPKPKKNSSQ
ncbi:DEAD/DEAH box helicase [Desertivirga brevis]|uniref:DEAD/DEAH box helicase n=1 Tax=Desertivirga brevis TaxID=2810310 RepID=UPI001A962DC2